MEFSNNNVIKMNLILFFKKNNLHGLSVPSPVLPTRFRATEKQHGHCQIIFDGTLAGLPGTAWQPAGDEENKNLHGGGHWSPQCEDAVSSATWKSHHYSKGNSSISHKLYDLTIEIWVDVTVSPDVMTSLHGYARNYQSCCHISFATFFPPPS